VSEALLSVKDLARSYGGVRAADGISLTVRKGEIRCIIGPNGAGKSTLFKMLVGEVRPDEGSIQFDGSDITHLAPHRRALRGIGIKHQNISVYGSLTIRHNFYLPLRHARGVSDIEAAMRSILARIRLSGWEDRLAGELSHGQRQWLAIGMALAMRPRLLLLDEPTAGMGPEETKATSALIREVMTEGMTALVVEHDMAFVRQLQAPVTVMHYGKVFAEGSLDEIEAHADVRRIYLGSARSQRN
jgi:branched-chain amino acid transport system ATP-binding protein